MMEYKFGSVCQARCGAPARVVTDEWCLWVSAMSNDLMLTRGVRPLPEGGWHGVLPTLTECERARAFLAATPPLPTQDGFDIGELAED